MPLKIKYGTRNEERKEHSERFRAFQGVCVLYLVCNSACAKGWGMAKFSSIPQGSVRWQRWHFQSSLDMAGLIWETFKTFVCTLIEL